MSNLTWARGGGGHGGLGWRFLKVKCDHNNIMCGGREGDKCAPQTFSPMFPVLMSLM